MNNRRTASKVLLAAILTASAIYLAAPAAAQDRPQNFQAALKAACGKEINRQCSGVQNTRGQLLACLYEHQSTLSLRCEGVIWSSMESLGKALGKIDSVQRDCDRDERQYCKEVLAGGGHLVACLLPTVDSVAPQCKATVYSIWDKRKNRG